MIQSKPILTLLLIVLSLFGISLLSLLLIENMDKTRIWLSFFINILLIMIVITKSRTRDLSINKLFMIIVFGVIFLIGLLIIIMLIPSDYTPSTSYWVIMINGYAWTVLGITGMVLVMLWRSINKMKNN